MTETLHTLVPLVNGDYAWIDVDDLPKVRQYRWYKKRSKDRKRWYVLTTNNFQLRENVKPGHISLHRLVNETPQGLHTDHINGNGLDNRKSNLRSVTHAQNQWNQKKCGVRVTLRPYNRWEASIRHNRTSVYLGTFDSREAAVERYWQAVLELRGPQFYRKDG